MQILETTPTYYRVQLDSGQVLTIAKTAGTTQMLGAGGAGPNAGAQSAPSPVQGMAGGGVMPGEIDPYAGDTIGMGVTLPEFLPDPFTQTVQTGVVPQFGPGQVAAPPGPMAAPAPMATPPPAGPMTGRGAVATVATPTGDVYTTAEGKPVAETTEPGGEAKAVAESKTAGGQYEPEAAPNPELDQDLAALLQPSWLPGQQGGASGPAPDAGALNAATRALADTQAKEQEALAAHYASMRPPGAPPNTPVDPGQFYERVGRMFGANNPKSARLIGGIATGLIAAVGEFGAALTHRQNVAAGMIQNAIEENIRQQEGAQALTRQQWLDQVAYSTQMANNKILQMAATAKAPEIRAQGEVLVAKNNLAMLASAVKNGAIDEKNGKALIQLETSRGDDVAYLTSSGTTPAGPGAAIREKLGKAPIVGDVIGPPPKDTASLALRDAANASFAAAMSPADKSPMTIKEAWATYPNAMYAPGDSTGTMEEKAKIRAVLRRSREAIHGKAIRGTDPKGAGTVTPNARPN